MGEPKVPFLLRSCLRSRPLGPSQGGEETALSLLEAPGLRGWVRAGACGLGAPSQDPYAAWRHLCWSETHGASDFSGLLGCLGHPPRLLALPRFTGCFSDPGESHPPGPLTVGRSRLHAWGPPGVGPQPSCCRQAPLLAAGGGGWGGAASAPPWESPSVLHTKAPRTWLTWAPFLP